MSAAPEDGVEAPGVGMLVCEAGGRPLAIPLAGILGVTEPSPVTPLPFSPPAIDGLVLAMNYAIVQMTLAPLLGAPPPPAGEGAIVVVARGDDVRALRLDAVLAMTEVVAASIVQAPPGAEAPPFVSGTFEWGGRTVGLLDLAALWSMGSLPPDALPPDEGTGLLLAIDALDAHAPAVEARERIPFLLFASGGESYAVASAAVEEILLVGAVRPMPGAPAWVAGLVDRHGVPILALDTRRLLGHDTALRATTALVVFRPAGGTLALLVEQAQGIVFFENEDPHPLTEVVAGIASYLVDEAGRIVGLLDVPKLMDQVAGPIEALMPRGVEAGRAVAAPLAAPSSSERLLTLEVGGEVFALALERVDRIRPDVSITPLPRSGTGFSGVVDVGETAVPVLDLRQRLGRGDPAPSPSGRPPCILARLEGAVAGLVVDRVLRIESVDRARIDAVEPQDRLPVSGVFKATDGRLASILMIDRLLPLLPADVG